MPILWLSHAPVGILCLPLACIIFCSPCGVQEYFVRYWLLTFYAVCCFKIAHFMHMTEHTYPIFSTTRLVYIHTPALTHTCLSTKGGVLERGLTALWLLLFIAVDFWSVLFFIKWTARWLQNCGNRQATWLCSRHHKGANCRPSPWHIDEVWQAARIRAVAGAWNCTWNWVMIHVLRVGVEVRWLALIACKWCDPK